MHRRFLNGFTAASLAALVSGTCAILACESGAPASSAPALPVAGPNAVSILLKSQPPGATILVDGVSAGPAPVRVSLNPGPHRIKASMSGYYPMQEQKIQVGTDAPTEHTLTLIASH